MWAMNADILRKIENVANVRANQKRFDISSGKQGKNPY